MKDEYIIINKSVLKKRIEELREVCNKELGYASCKIYFELEHLIPKSTPLIPVLEETFEAGCDYGEDSANSDSGVSENFLNKEEYIANLNFNALDNEQKNS